MHGLHQLLVIVTLLFTAIGCGSTQDPGPFGPPKESPLLAPFGGEWVFDFDKTLAAQQAAGTSAEEVDKLRAFYAENPQFGRMHPDLNITGDVAVSAGAPSSEYRFFAMHEHDGKVCGKAWHHEDRYDPGDMSKCYVRLTIKDNDLQMSVKMRDGLPDLNDPDLQPSLEGSRADCEADRPALGWSEWTTYVFSRKK